MAIYGIHNMACGCVYMVYKRIVSGGKTSKLHLVIGYVDYLSDALLTKQSE